VLWGRGCALSWRPRTSHWNSAGSAEHHARFVVKFAGARECSKRSLHPFCPDKVIIQKRNGQRSRFSRARRTFPCEVLRPGEQHLIFRRSGYSEPIRNRFSSRYSTISTAFLQFAPRGRNGSNSQGNGGGSRHFPSVAPHTVARLASVSLQQGTSSNAKSSLMFAIMERGGSGTDIQTSRVCASQRQTVSYGMTQCRKRISGVVQAQASMAAASVSFLKQHVPHAIRPGVQRRTGQAIHDKFIPVWTSTVRTCRLHGSYNLAEGGEESNEDNLLAYLRSQGIAERSIAVAAIRLGIISGSRAMQVGTTVKPCMLSPCGAQPKWWARGTYGSKTCGHKRERCFIRAIWTSLFFLRKASRVTTSNAKKAAQLAKLPIPG